MSIADKLTTVAENMPKVYEAGQQAEYDRFWDAYQENGNRTHYAYAFYRWSDAVFSPKYDITMTGNAYCTFYSCKFGNLEKECIADGVDLYQTFANSQLHTIDYLQVSAGTTYTSAFYKASQLQNLNIVGVIGNNGFNVSACPLSHESLMSIINCLENKTADTSGTKWVVTLGATNLAKLEATEAGMNAIAEATQKKGWDLA